MKVKFERALMVFMQRVYHDVFFLSTYKKISELKSKLFYEISLVRKHNLDFNCYRYADKLCYFSQIVCEIHIKKKFEVNLPYLTLRKSDNVPAQK